MRPEPPVEIVFPPHVGLAAGLIGIALLILYGLWMWNLIERLMKEEKEK